MHCDAWQHHAISVFSCVVLLLRAPRRYGEPARVIIQGTAAEETARAEKWNRLQEHVSATEAFLSAQREEAPAPGRDSEQNSEVAGLKKQPRSTGNRLVLCDAESNTLFDFKGLRTHVSFS